MKTPREILLQRHRAAQPRLDEIRRDAISRFANPPGLRTEWSPLRALHTLWRELIWPARRVWAGLATTWVFILIANANLSEGRPVASTETKAQSAGLWLMFQEQNQLIAELSGAAESKRSEPALTPPSRSNSKQPRSDRAIGLKLV